MTLDELISASEEMQQQLGREWYLTGAGLKDEPQIEAIFSRFAYLGGDGALEAAQKSGSLPLLDWVMDIRIGQRTAPLEERQLLWEQGAVVSLDGTEVPYLRVPIELSNSPDHDYRRRLEAERNRIGSEALTTLRADRFAAERDTLASLGFGDYVETIGRMSEIDLDALGLEAEEFLVATDDMYRDSLTRVVRRRMGMPLNELTRADTAWLFRGDDYDAAFPPERLVSVAERQMREMGLDAHQNGRVRIDTEERPNKQPRAFCVPVHVPNEVYLVLRPSGGHGDYRTFWHELGHAMHFAAVDPEQSFEARWLGDHSVTEGFAMLWDHLTITRAWLLRYTEIRPEDAASLVFELAVSELHLIRRYAAKLGYELLLHRSDYRGVAAEYAERLTRATRFRYGPENFLIDVDPAFYSARYLRAWQLEAIAAHELTQRFDEDWWRNPRAGSFVHHLMARGQADSAHRLAQDVFGRSLGFDACARRLQTLLD